MMICQPPMPLVDEQSWHHVVVVLLLLLVVLLLVVGSSSTSSITRPEKMMVIGWKRGGYMDDLLDCFGGSCRT